MTAEEESGKQKVEQAGCLMLDAPGRRRRSPPGTIAVSFQVHHFSFCGFIQKNLMAGLSWIKLD